MLCIKRDGRIFARCNDIVELAEKIHKKAIFLLIGSNPHPNILSDEWISNTERARKMAEWRSQFPPIKITNKNIKPQHVALAVQSIHVHIQGKGPKDVHLFIGNCKNYSVPQLAQYFKGVSSRIIRKNCWNNVKGKLWGNQFWSNGYFYEAVGRITSETAKFYIERQQEKHWTNIDYEDYQMTQSEGQTTLMDFTAPP